MKKISLKPGAVKKACIDFRVTVIDFLFLLCVSMSEIAGKRRKFGFLGQILRLCRDIFVNLHLFSKLITIQ